MTKGQHQNQIQNPGPQPGHQIREKDMTILMKDLDTIREELSRRTLADIPGYADQTVSTRRAIHELAPILLEKKENGFKTAALVAMLADLQITIKGPTLTRYLKECQEDKKKTNSRPSKSKPADAAPKGASPASAQKKPKTDSGTTDTSPAVAIQKSDIEVANSRPQSVRDNDSIMN